MTAVWKFPIALGDSCEVSMPAGAHPLHVGVQDGQPVLWARVNPDAPREPRRFRIAGTGHPLDATVGRHVGSFTLLSGELVFHVFDVAQRESEEERMKRPKIVCLCGSTRFWETFRDVGLKLTLEGVIVLSIGICAPDAVVLANPESDEGRAQRAALDVLHKQKIDLADEVLVLNVGGYIGDSTRGEIAHARATGKPVVWLEPDKATG